MAEATVIKERPTGAGPQAVHKSNGEAKGYKESGRGAKTEGKTQNRQKETKSDKAKGGVSEVKGGKRPQTAHKAKAKESQQQIPFEAAKKAIEVITSIQDEKQVVVSPEELREFKKFLYKYSDLSSKVIEKMDYAELVVAAQEVLRCVPEIELEDLKYSEGSPASEDKVTWQLLRDQIKQAQSSDEEELTVAKVEEYLKAEGFESVGIGAGVGAATAAAEAPEWLEELPDESEVPEAARSYLREIERFGRVSRSPQDEYRDLQALQADLNQAIRRGEVDDADEAVRTTREVLTNRIGDLEIEIAAARARAESEMIGQRRGRATLEDYLPIKREVGDLIDEMLDLAEGGQRGSEEWNEKQARLDQILGEAVTAAQEKRNYQKVYEVTRAVEDAALINRRNADRTALLKEIASHNAAGRFAQFTSRDDPVRFLSQLDGHFQNIFDRLSKDEQNAIVGDIDLKANNYYISVAISSWRDLEDAVGDLVETIRAKKEVEGLREWKGIKAVAGLEAAIKVKQETAVPANWDDIPEHLANIYNKAESTDFSIDDLGPMINEAINMVRVLPTNTVEFREKRRQLIKELESFRAIHSLRITLERQDFDPSNLLDVFRNYFDDETWVHFVSRFGRDERERAYLDKNGEAVNLLDVSFELYSERLRQERIKMNMVEEMTRHAIANEFSAGTYNDFENWLGIELTPKLREQIEELRQYFVEKMPEKIREKYPELAGMSVDEIWGRKGTVTRNGREINPLDVTHDVIQDWHMKKTLQGAFGICGKDDLGDLAREFGISEEKASDEFLGKPFLDIRQDEIKEQLVAQLAGLGLRINLAGKSEPADFRLMDLEMMKEIGILDSVDYNAYYLTWTMEWFNYDSIRIYSRDSKSKLRDDYDHLVYHQNTNSFFGRQVDQSWEFYSETNENRGHPKENDVNRIWKQFLPGKHSWLFPQNNVMTRWVDFFMTLEQEREVEIRARQMMQEWDFDNEKYHPEFVTWMKNVVKRDMIESGELSFGVGAKKFSQVANEVRLRKFEYIDVFIDRTKHKQFTDPANFQNYLGGPTEDKFITINNTVAAFYSTRDARLFPWMTLAMRAHWEIANKHSMRLFDRQDVQSQAMEDLVDRLVTSDFTEKEQAVEFKRKNLGFIKISPTGSQEELGISNAAKDLLALMLGNTLVRRYRQIMENGRKLGWDARFLPIMALFVLMWEMLKRSVQFEQGRS